MQYLMMQLVMSCDILVNAELNGESSSVEISGLKPGRNYDVRVIASSGAGFSQADAIVIALYPNKTFGK
jgi:hypothetical protein